MANYKSGKDGYLTVGSSPLAGVRNIQFTQNSNNPQFATSQTAGYKSSVSGVKSGTVNFDIVVDFDDYVFDRINVGDQVTLLINEDATRQWSVPIGIDSIAETLDINDGGEITAAVTAHTRGAWTAPS